MTPYENGIRHGHWVATSIVLLSIYLAFFHLCLTAEYWQCTVLGVLCSSIWAAVCYVRCSVFLNRFEYWIHQFVALDILLEGFSPLHDGLGFYYCATGFWIVFIVYRVVEAQRRPGQITGPKVPATS